MKPPARGAAATLPEKQSTLDSAGDPPGSAAGARPPPPGGGSGGGVPNAAALEPFLSIIGGIGCGIILITVVLLVTIKMRCGGNGGGGDGLSSRYDFPLVALSPRVEEHVIRTRNNYQAGCQ